MIRCGTLGVISSCTTAMYTGRVMDTINTHHATQRESVSHCLPTCILTDWVEQCLVNRQLFMENRHEQTSSVEQYSSHRGSDILIALCLLAFLAMVGFGFVYAFPQFEQAAIIMAWLFLGLVFVVVGYLIWHRKRVDDINLQAIADENRRKNEMHELQRETIQLPADVSGNYPAIYNARTQNVIVLQPGQFIQPVPNHYAPHFHYQDTSTRVSEEKQNLLASGVQSPTMEYVISQLKYNTLQVCLGVSLETGKPFVMDLIEGTHYRIIGGSGFGKSCEAAAILEQVTQSNDPDHLLISLLDLEHKTSRLFEDLPHVAELQIGRKRVECVATNADEVAQHFRYLRDELDRRKALSEYDLQRERFMLIYVEEFLSLKREVDPELKTQMMDDFTILALRGRKYGLYLLACAQVDYSDKSLRDAMNQFNVNMSFSVKPSAARAVGFSSNDLLKQNFEAKQRGQFVLETTGCTDIMLAPQFDVKAKLQRLQGASQGANQGATRVLNSTIEGASTYPAPSVAPIDAPAWEAYLEPIQALRARGFNQDEIIEKLWGAKKGSNQRYQDAREIYRLVAAYLHQIEESEE